MTIPPGLTVFIPVYNEEALLAKNARRLAGFLELLHIPYQIIIGSNGSTDGTVALGNQLGREQRNIHFFHLPGKGVGAAFREGVRKARFKRIITVDMDLSIELEFIRAAYHLLSTHDIVIGSKTTGSQNRSWVRKTGSRAFTQLVKIFLHINIHDYSIAAKGYRKKLVNRYLSYVDEQTFYVVQIVYRALRDGFRMVEIPVECNDIRGSRFNLVREGVYKFSKLIRLWLAHN